MKFLGMIRAKRKRSLLFHTIVTSAAFIGIGGIILFFVLWGLPDPTRLSETAVAQSTKIYDRTGTVVLYEVHGTEKRTVVPFEQIPLAVKEATIATEDSDFYSHNGVDVRGIIRALYKDLRSGNFRQGGSTITQQLVKNSLLTGERSLTRKIREAVLAIIIESRFSKDEILGMYLNQVPYGSYAYGVQAASRTYFGKDVQNISLAESALLAAMLKAPTYYSPFGNHVDELMARKDMALERMAKLGFISESDAAGAKRETLGLKKQNYGILAPHFVAYIREYLTDTYGESYVEKGGLKVTTALDWDLQQKAEELVNEYGQKNKSLIKGFNAALVSMDPKTGEIIAMVGSRDYFGDPEPAGCKSGINCKFDPQVNVTLRSRQPGSSFKPFVYATAFAKGYTDKTVLFDVPTEFNTACNADGTAPAGYNPKNCYMPGNYDEQYRGPVTARAALAQSLNVPSVEFLYLAGVDDSITTANRLGIITIQPDPSRYGLALVLGGAEVRLLDMVHAYGAFARDGMQIGMSGILKIEDAEGHILEEKKDEPGEVLEPQIARIINDILSDNEARQPVFAPHSSLYFPDREVAAKTGTTQDYRDAWTIGYTPSIVTGVWVGNNDNTPIQQKGSGVLAAAPLWHAFMEEAFKKIPAEPFAKPAPEEITKPILKGLWQGGTVVTIDKITGKLATAETPLELREDRVTGEPHTILYWVDRSNPRGPIPDNPAQDPQFQHWETALRAWLSGNPLGTNSDIPREYDTVHTEANRPRIRLESPLLGDVVRRGSDLIIRGSVTAVFPLKEIDILINDRIVQTLISPPGTFNLKISTKDLAPGDLILRVRAVDSVENRAEAAVTLLLSSD